MKQFSPFRLDSANQCLWRDDARIPLRPKAFAVLSYLVHHAGRLVTQNELLEALWPDTFVQPEVLKSHILEVRAALGDNPKSPSFIETLPRRGYRFIKEVTESNGHSLPAPASTAASLIGRERELAKLEGYFDQACAGRGQVVFVTGEAGIGKTRLVDAFTTATAQRVSGIRMSTGQCVEGYGAQEPYYPVLVALARLLREEEELVRLLETHAPTWLVQFPGLVKPEHRQTLQREILGATRERMLRELCDVLPLISAEKPLVLVLEDIHLADSATIDLIATIPLRPSSAKLLLVATYQPVEVVLAQHPLKMVKQKLSVHKLCHELAIEPLAETEVALYLAAESSGKDLPHGLTQVLYRHSEGNPLFLRAARDHLISRGYLSRGDEGWRINVPLEEIEMEVPESLRQMLEIQIERLSEEERRVLDIACVCGVYFLANVAATAGELDLEKCEDICQKLALRGQILTEAGLKELPNGVAALRFKFAHGFYRRTIYDRLSLQRRSRIHLRIGHALEPIFAEAPGEIAAELLLHFEHGSDWKRAAKYLQLVAANESRRFAYREAASALEHALTLLAKLPTAERTAGEIEVMRKLGAAYYVLEDFPLAISTLKAVTTRAALARDSRAEISAWIQLAFVWGRMSVPQGMEAVNRLFELSDRERDPVLRTSARMSARLTGILAGSGKAQDLQQFQNELTEISAHADQRLLAVHTAEYAHLQFFVSEYEASIRNIEMSMPALIETADIRYTSGLLIYVMALIFSGNLGKAMAVVQKALVGAQKNQNVSRERVLRLFQAWPHLCAGDWAGALGLCESVLPRLRNTYQALYLRQGLIFAGMAQIGLGRYEIATRVLSEVREAMESEPVAFDWFLRMPLQSALAELALKQMNLDAARQEAQKFLECTQATSEHTWQALAWETSARVAMAESNEPRARECITKALATMQGYNLPLAAWRVHRVAMHLFPENAAEHHRLYEAEVHKLAHSLDDFPQLRESLLATSGIRQDHRPPGNEPLQHKNAS